MKKAVGFLCLCLCIWLNTTAWAASDSDSAVQLQRIERYLNSINTFSASFSQVASDGSAADGVFYLSRPGKLRWEYRLPTPITIVLRGGVLAYYDPELDELSHIPADNVIASFLTQESISLSGNKQLGVAFETKKPHLILTIWKNDQISEGYLKLLFEDKENKIFLKELQLLDPIGVTSTIVFDDIVQNSKLQDSVFSIQRNNRFKRQ